MGWACYSVSTCECPPYASILGHVTDWPLNTIAFRYPQSFELAHPIASMFDGSEARRRPHVTKGGSTTPWYTFQDLPVLVLSRWVPDGKCAGPHAEECGLQDARPLAKPSRLRGKLLHLLRSSALGQGLADVIATSSMRSLERRCTRIEALREYIVLQG